MNNRGRLIFVLGAGLVALTVLVTLTILTPPSLTDMGQILLFGAMIAFAMSYSIPIGGGQVSLMPMSLAAVYLIHGRVIAGWAVCLGMVGHAGVRRWRGWRQPESQEPRGRLLFEATTLNISMHTLGVLAAGTVYQSQNGPVPLRTVDLRVAGLLLVFTLVYTFVNHMLVASYLALRGLIPHYLKSVKRVLLYETGPLIFTPLIALIHTRLGRGYFALFALALSLFSLISHHLALTSQRLQRRLQELGSLQAVGRALSSSLDIETVVSTIHEQVSKLMAAPSFYIALYNQESNEVSFPVAVEKGERVQWRSRRARHGLTEYVVQTKQPILISSNVMDKVVELGLEHIGNPAACWLGIPIVAGDTALGMMALQSPDTPGAYDTAHMEILQMIAAQAAVAIQNARLYERTDEALARRVQELQARNEELDAFSHTVAHDLKGPLSSLILYSSFLETMHDQMETEKRAAHLATITRSSMHMSTIIDELLLLASVRKTEKVEVRALAMNEILGSIRERLAHQIEEKHAELAFPDHWPTALGRAQWVEEVWVNYISNAIKYGGTPPRVELGYEMLEGGSSMLDGDRNPLSTIHLPPPTIKFTVRDNGEGLTPEQQSALFAPFERLHQTRAEGHGLGLSIVRRIVEKLGGEVGVESEVGRGSTFWFTLPRAEQETEARDKARV